MEQSCDHLVYVQIVTLGPGFAVCDWTVAPPGGELERVHRTRARFRLWVHKHTQCVHKGQSVQTCFSRTSWQLQLLMFHHLLAEFSTLMKLDFFTHPVFVTHTLPACVFVKNAPTNFMCVLFLFTQTISAPERRNVCTDTLQRFTVCVHLAG